MVSACVQWMELSCTWNILTLLSIIGATSPSRKTRATLEACHVCVDYAMVTVGYDGFCPLEIFFLYGTCAFLSAPISSALVTAWAIRGRTSWQPWQFVNDVAQLG